MDIGHLVFPFIMAVITNSIMIVAIYFLRKIPYFANLFSIWFMVILYLFCILRVFLPIEFPDVQIILRDNVVFNGIVEAMMNRTEQATGQPTALFFVVLGVWLLGTVIIAVVSACTQKRKTTYFLANYDFTTDEQRELFRAVSQEILGADHKVTVKFTDAVDRIMVTGYRRCYVLLPVGEYSMDELEMIFRHECTHIRNKDLWLKLLVHIYCAIFWWNPFSYLLKHDLSFTLEIKCDLVAVRGLSDEKVQMYFDALTKKRGKEDKDKKQGKLRRWFGRLFRNPYYLNAEFSERRKGKKVFQRIRAIAAKPPKKAVQVIVNTVVSLVFVAIFVLSYLFIWQPFYGSEIAEDNYDLTAGEVVIDDSNGYLQKQLDGSYYLIFADYPPIPISAEEVEAGMYDDYPILDN